ncbi:MAG: TetR/AcrR family transcriptional regulator [Muribaculum sp.]|nr:TetR/AcrR family transcriptional regulator [Muribaculum sp.]
MANTTREKLIEVARQLFDRKGLENTTMSDIASASDKGRRTIYTYFKNKRDIYNAVLERESENIIFNVRQAVIQAGDSPQACLDAFIDARIELIANETVARKDISVYKSFFAREVRRLERVRRIVLQKEFALLGDILTKGVAMGCFAPDRSDIICNMLQLIFQGIEVKWLHECNRLSDSDVKSAGADIKTFVNAALRP